MNAIIWYRLERWLYLHHLTLLAKIVRGGVYLFYNSFIPYTCEIGKNTKFGYKGMGVVIHSNAKIGENCLISQQVTIGGRSKIPKVPVIGNNVFVGCGAKILGDVVIGNECVIGANAVVIHSVEPRSVVVGVPARVIKTDINIGDYV